MYILNNTLIIIYIFLPIYIINKLATYYPNSYFTKETDKETVKRYIPTYEHFFFEFICIFFIVTNILQYLHIKKYTFKFLKKCLIKLSNIL